MYVSMPNVQRTLYPAGYLINVHQVLTRALLQVKVCFKPNGGLEVEDTPDDHSSASRATGCDLPYGQ